MLKKPGLLAAAGLAIVAVAAAAFFFLFMGGSDPVDPEEAAAEVEASPVHVAGKLGPHITLEDRVFTLRSPEGTPRYAKLQIVIEFETEDAIWFEISGEALEEKLAEFGAAIPIALIEDAITTAVSSKSIDDIATPAGKDTLREDIRVAVATLLPEPQVRRVLFTSFITQ